MVLLEILSGPGTEAFNVFFSLFFWFAVAMIPFNAVLYMIKRGA